MATPSQNLHLLSSSSMIAKSFIPKKQFVRQQWRTSSTAPYMVKSLINRPEYIPNKISDPSYVRILDTTLRDGEQTPGVNFSSDQKLEIAAQLARLGVDVIEAGFPASSPLAAEDVKHIAAAVGNGREGGMEHVPVINAVARCVKSDIDVTWKAVRDAKKPRMTMFIATSEIHMRHKLRMSKSEVLRIVKDALWYTRSLGSNDVAFCAEDSSRTENEFLYKVFETAIEAGATTLILADTVGCMFPNEWGRLIADVRKYVRGVDNVVLSTHCHNDLGLSTANTLAALEAGARQVEGSINGIGERAGNVALEEVVMAIKYRERDVIGGLRSGINTTVLAPTSQMVEEYSGLTLQPNKCIVGANIFLHASGIHQAGVLKHRETYEILSPEDIGKCSTQDLGIILGKYSGRHALQSKLQQLGYEVDDTKFETLFSRFKEMAHNKKDISDDDLKSLM